MKNNIMKNKMTLMAAVAAIAISACSSAGYNDGAHGYNQSAHMGGQYQMANGYQSAPQQANLGSGYQTQTGFGQPSGCAGPVSAPLPCRVSAPVNPCPAPVAVPVPAPCSMPAPAPVNPCSVSGSFPAPVSAPVSPCGSAPLMVAYPSAVSGPVMVMRPIPYGMRGSYMEQKQDYFYGEIGAVNYDAFKRNAGVQGRLGYQSDGLLGAEVEGSYAFVMRDKDKITPVVHSVSLANTDVYNLGVKHSYAGFAVARTEVTEAVNILARIGYHQSKEKLYKDPDCSNIRPCPEPFYDTQTSKGLAIGAGVEAEISPNNVVRADVTGYDMKDGYRTALSLGYQRKF